MRLFPSLGITQLQAWLGNLIVAVPPLQKAQRLRQLYQDTASSWGRQLSEAEWAQAASLSSLDALRAALHAGSAAEKRLVSEHLGFLVSLVNKFSHQVW